MLPNEEFALACRAYYEEQGLIVDKTNGQFAHCPLPKGMGETGYYLLWEHHQQQGLLQSRDVGRCCFWVGHAKQWLEQLNYFPEKYFELWDIYEEFSQPSYKVGFDTEAQKRATQGRKKHWNSEAGEQRKQKIRQRRMHNAKRVQITFEDGRVGVYPNAHFAGKALGVSFASVSLWARNKVKPTRNIQVCYT